MEVTNLENRPKVQNKDKKFKLKTLKKILISNYGTLFDLLLYNNKSEVICSGNDHEISFWNLETLKSTLVLKGHTNTITKVAVCPEDQNLLFSTSADKTVRVWKIKRKEQENGQNEDEIESFTIKNPDNKTTMGAVFIDSNRIVFGQCLNKAYFYNIQEKKVEHVYEFDVQNLENVKNIIQNEKTIIKDHIQEKIEENSNNNKKESGLQKQSWVTELGYMGKNKILILCENSRLHFINPDSFKAEKIFNDSHGGHILSMKIYDNYILLGGSDSWTYFYEFDEKSYDLILRLKMRGHVSACATVDFWFDQKNKNDESFAEGYQGLPVGGIVTAAFDPIVKFYDFKGEFVFKIDDIASPVVWDSEKQTIVGRDHNITREIMIQHFI